MKQIPLHSTKYNNLFALVDDDDYELISKYRWTVTKRPYTFYAVRADYSNGKKNKKIIYMHRLIMGFDHNSKKMVDHRDNNGLNNQRENLREATKSQNSMNGNLRKNKTSKYRGVTKHFSRRKWTAGIYINGKRKHLGCFESEIEAAKEYNKAAVEMFGEFANINKITA